MMEGLEELHLRHPLPLHHHLMRRTKEDVLDLLVWYLE
jgi:hypothetical protein